MVHQVSVAFVDALEYRTHRPHNRLLGYAGKMATSAADLVKALETTMKPYMFENSGAVTFLSFLNQVERVCDCNRVLEGVAV